MQTRSGTCGPVRLNRIVLPLRIKGRWRMASGTGRARESAPDDIEQRPVLAPEGEGECAGVGSRVRAARGAEAAPRRCPRAPVGRPAGSGRLRQDNRARGLLPPQAAQGAVAAWISLDGDDTPTAFGSYLVYAFECAGLDLSVLSDPDVWSSSPATCQIGMLARAIELHAEPCLLVLDEVDRLPRETVDLIQRLVEHGPSNLHLALAFRANPGLDLAMRVLDGSGTR